MTFSAVRLISLLGAASFLISALLAQAPSNQNQSIPDVPTLMQQVMQHQKEVDKIREDYTFREFQQTDDLDGDGHVKKSQTEEDEIFFVNGHHISRTVKKNGKELSPDDQKKEQDRVNKEVEKALKTPPHRSVDGEEISISKILAVMKVSDPRRELLNGRSTLSFDFVGDPHAKTHGMMLNAAKKMSGTLWIDEADREVARLQVRFEDNFHIGAGLVATVQKGTSFEFDQALVNHELWLPTGSEMHLGARVMLLKGYRQNIHIKDNDYQKFHAEASMQPGATVVSPQH
jgi:hypothetical protein